MPISSDNSQTNRTGENGLLCFEPGNVPAFLWRAHQQSGFENLPLANAKRSQTDGVAMAG